VRPSTVRSSTVRSSTVRSSARAGAEHRRVIGIPRPSDIALVHPAMTESLKELIKINSTGANLLHGLGQLGGDGAMSGSMQVHTAG
jgi:dihydrodipicolinate synthase/N-acetylneuraminate lyase